MPPRPVRQRRRGGGLARHATVSQLARTLRSYTWAGPAAGTEGEPEEGEPRRVSFGFTDEGAWRLSALLPPDEGAVVERALHVARQSLAEEGDQPTWADALVGVAERCLGEGATARPHRDRHVVLIHMEVTDHGPAAHLHLGPVLPDAIRRHLGCDGRVRVVTEANGTPLNVGRAQRIVPERTRVTVEDRDRGCRVPGCERTRWLHVHHVVHWEDGGPTDTANLVALCARHHRLHHLGQLGIEGDADAADGVVFTDSKGRRLTGAGRPAPPGDLTVTGTWVHPSGERLDPRWVHFSERAGAA